MIPSKGDNSVASLTEPSMGGGRSPKALDLKAARNSKKQLKAAKQAAVAPNTATKVAHATLGKHGSWKSFEFQSLLGQVDQVRKKADRDRV